MPHGAQRRVNRLGNETSPYLLQHALNPVDWYPWGPEALARARLEQRPIFLSIGYSACHWCHVMERESFEDERIARFMNAHFVNVKVDREERPDLDEIYMKAVIAMDGAGGWPMSVFLTPELEPFHGGTYFPPFARHGRPGFADVLARVAQLWEERPEKLREQAARMTRDIARSSAIDARAALPRDVLDLSLGALVERHDPVFGGFGDAPKFPHANDIRLLLRHARRTGRDELRAMAAFTLERMARGGIHDQLAGGFARYSTDEEWLVPHFEKMLYDNALLVPAYLEGHLATGRGDFARVARRTCEWMLREMQTPEGAFASSQDADSEGEEGRYYVWTPGELREVLGTSRARLAAEWFGVREQGNFEGGTSVLHRPHSDAEVAAALGLPLEELEASMEEARALLLAARARRAPPPTDDKVLPAWNGLAITALALASQVLGERRFLAAARRAATFLLDGMRRPDGRLHASARGGRAHLEGCLDDYAFLVQGLIDLYESDFDERWLREALALQAVQSELFEDGRHGGWFTTGSHHERLIVRMKNPHDGALPAGNGVSALNLLRLAELSGSVELALAAERTLTSVGALVPRYPAAFGSTLIALDFLEAGPREVVLAGEPHSEALEALLAVVRSSFLPQRVVALAHGGASVELIPLLHGRGAPPGRALAYVCRNHVCKAPIEGPDELERALAAP